MFAAAGVGEGPLGGSGNFIGGGEPVVKAAGTSVMLVVSIGSGRARRDVVPVYGFVFDNVGCGGDLNLSVLSGVSGVPLFGR